MPNAKGETFDLGVATQRGHPGDHAQELDMDIDLHQNLYGLHLDAIYAVIKLSQKCVNFLKILILEVIMQQPKWPS